MDLSSLQISLSIIMPEITLSAFGILVLLLGVFSSSTHDGKDHLGYISLFGVILALIFSIPLFGKVQYGFSGMVAADQFAVFFKIVFGLICLLTILISIGYTRQEGISFGEYYVLVLFSTVGMMLMAAGTNLIIIFLGLETMSISVYVLAGIMRNNPRSVESAMKYFILGAFATGFFLYGVALIYGSTGSFNLKEIASYLATSGEGGRSALLIIGIALLTIGFGFKISTVPFHMWTPDVYEGAPTSITAFMATGVKAAAFAGLVRVFYSALGAFQSDWTAIMWLLSVATMTVGNIVAISQSNIKRMLAYSSIAHAGYILVGFTAGNDLGTSSILFYLLAYTFMNIGAFTVVILLGRKGEENILITDYSGIGFKYPLLAASMTIFLLSLAGIPPLAGFMGKFYIFSAAVKAKFYWLAIIGVLNSALSVYYYLRVTVYMYFREAEGETARLTFSPGAVVGLVIAVAGVFYLGIFPAIFLALARDSIRVLM
ncbi:MAG: NADH-quinone oxidoreductase subunit NuoN [Proteobacteria bacterium]|nr:NADH-quinone oxidoreductase subunit NuoN [Pseudomonadota bacterium]NIS67385.1 NADH-quinone oxidoreductase subunit NuoN [Pseudomonadota bacterium]